MGRGGLRFSLSLLLQFPSYDVISDVIMSDADCTPGCEARSVAASLIFMAIRSLLFVTVLIIFA